MITGLLISPKVTEDKETNERSVKISMTKVQLNTKQEEPSGGGIKRSIARNVHCEHIQSIDATCDGSEIKAWIDEEGFASAPRLSNGEIFALKISTTGPEMPLIGDLLITGSVDNNNQLTSCPVSANRMSRIIEGTSLVPY